MRKVPAAWIAGSEVAGEKGDIAEGGIMRKRYEES
jgi:hypothetical protein